MDNTYTADIKITSSTGVETFSANLRELSEEDVDKVRRVIMEVACSTPA